MWIGWVESDIMVSCDITQLPQFRLILSGWYWNQLHSDQLTCTWENVLKHVDIHLFGDVFFSHFRQKCTYFWLNWFPTLQGDVLHLAVVTDNGKVLSRDLSSCGEKHNLNIKKTSKHTESQTSRLLNIIQIWAVLTVWLSDCMKHCIHKI